MSYGNKPMSEALKEFRLNEKNDDLDGLRRFEVTKDYKSPAGFYAKKGAKGHVSSTLDGGFHGVIFDDESLNLIKSNGVRGNTLDIPAINIKIDKK